MEAYLSSGIYKTTQSANVIRKKGEKTIFPLDPVESQVPQGLRNPISLANHEYHQRHRPCRYCFPESEPDGRATGLGEPRGKVAFSTRVTRQVRKALAGNVEKYPSIRPRDLSFSFSAPRLASPVRGFPGCFYPSPRETGRFFCLQRSRRGTRGGPRRAKGDEKTGEPGDFGTKRTMMVWVGFLR